MLSKTVNMLSADVKFGIGYDYSLDDLSYMESMVAGDLARMTLGIQFNDMDLEELEAYLILDRLSSTAGTGQVIREHIFDNEYQTKPFKSTSYWMERANQKVADARASRSINIIQRGVERSDVDMRALRNDNTLSPQYGNPSKAEWYRNVIGSTMGDK
jgi:hypothetical protein